VAIKSDLKSGARGRTAQAGRRLLALSDVAPASADAPLPTEFRLFKAGVNESTKGPTLFDAAAAAAVLAAFERGGVDLMIDLAHDSLSEGARVARDDADDARGWFRLAVRDGELWAVDVTWTPDGERRLRARTQRYVSPAFVVDDAGRVVEVINCALCSMPATLDAVPLVATRERAPQTRSNGSMDPKLIKEALDALEAGDATKALEILKSLIASAAGAPADAAPSAADAVAETADTAALRAEVAELRRAEAARAVELEELRAWRQGEDARRAAGEEAERHQLIGDLVRLRAETPATAWEPEVEGAPRKPVARLAGEPIDSLRARVAVLRAAGGNVERVPERTAPVLSDVERAVYDRLPNDAAKNAYVARRAARRASK